MRAPVTLLLLVLPALLAQTGPAAACPWLEGLGRACPRGDGLLDLVGPDGALLGTTHGLDPARSGAASLASARPPWCVERADPLDPHALVLYARAVDDAEQHALKAPVVRDLVAQANALVNDATVASAGLTSDVKVRCAGGEVVVLNVTLPTPLAQTTMATILHDLTAMGFNDPRIKHWVYFDDVAGCACAGAATMHPDDTPGPLNENNGYFASYAVTFGRDDPVVMLHELAHTMGAVPPGADHSTGAGHCWDGRDVMCYADAGPRAHLYTATRCAADVFDCGNDDYCDASLPPVGKPGTQAGRWNVCGRSNAFLRVGDGSPLAP
ncbi:MAG TPA: hypothetical protein VNX21_06840 [Candidatus Thermoplasmatota archaeon]|nr:hypothetical protein [Candidatus Thermoplasmatota archaeon]